MERKVDLARLKLVTGGQTGVDRAMLDFCLEHRIRCGGWCPEGRKAEDGIIHLKYPVKELPGASYKKRTAANVQESDATVIIYENRMEGGTLKSFEFVRKKGKPVLLLDMSVMDTASASSRLAEFLDSHNPEILNFSGPRQSEWPGGYESCYAILQLVFGNLQKSSSKKAGTTVHFFF